MMTRTFAVLFATLLMAGFSSAFVVSSERYSNVVTRTTTSTVALDVFGKKKKDEEDLSYIETRDMTRAEMEQLNKQNEDIMNAELIGMTIFSLVISVPMLYLVWVGFFSETSEMNL